MTRLSAATLVALAILSPFGSMAAPKEKILFNFADAPEGLRPIGGALLDGADGKLYGTTSLGGANCGTVFAKGLPIGALKYIWKFGAQPDGCQPYGRLIRDPAGEIYGTTYVGGEFGHGTAFRLTPPANPSGAWTETILWSFGGTTGETGANPSAGLAFANGTDASAGLYGTTTYGGNAFGTVFKLLPPGGVTSASRAKTWKAKTIYKFKNGRDGAHPWGGVVVDGDGSLYGTTNLGGSHNFGVVYKLTPGDRWENTPLYAFKGAGDGGNPGYVDLIAEIEEGQIVALYGTGKNGEIGGDNCGVVFKLARGNPRWVWTRLTQFLCIDTRFPNAGVTFVNGIDATDGLYGTTETSNPEVGGTGTVYMLTPAGNRWRRRILWNFQQEDFDGHRPIAPVTVVDGVIYGTTFEGGTGGGGTLFRITP